MFGANGQNLARLTLLAGCLLHLYLPLTHIRKFNITTEKRRMDKQKSNTKMRLKTNHTCFSMHLFHFHLCMRICIGDVQGIYSVCLCRYIIYVPKHLLGGPKEAKPSTHIYTARTSILSGWVARQEASQEILCGHGRVLFMRCYTYPHFITGKLPTNYTYLKHMQW